MSKVLSKEENQNKEENDEYSEIEEYVEHPNIEDKQTFTGNAETLTAKSFSDFGLNEYLLTNITNAQFENPTPVQIRAIPKILFGHDVLCQAKSGTGKTAVFVLSTLEEVYRDPSVKVGVITHNEDLSLQVFNEYLRFSKDLPIEIKCLSKITTGSSSLIVKYGKGSTIQPSIVIGTLKDFTNVLYKYDIVVVDECDLILSCEDNRRILDHLISNSTTPINYSLLMFTATLTKSTKKFCLSFMGGNSGNNGGGCCEIYVDDDTELSLHGLSQYFIDTKSANGKDNVIKKLDLSKKTIIFCNSSETALKLESQIGKGKCKAITDKNPIKSRITGLADFKNKKFPILITMDLLSRGIDIQGVEVVINFDIPKDPVTYLHRVGRTARLESIGTAITFVESEHDKVRINEIMYRYEVNIKRMEIN